MQFPRILPSRDLVEAAMPSQGRVIEGAIHAREVAEMQADFAGEQLAMMSESLADYALMFEDVGWRRMSAAGDVELTADGIKRGAELCRIMAVVNPLCKRGAELRAAYVWGQGVSITAKADDSQDGTQDVNDVLQQFMDDPSNQRVLFGAEAQQLRERALCTDGQSFFALYTDPVDGRVKVRSIPLAEMQDVITNPDDRDDPWYYKRSQIGTRLVVTANHETYTVEQPTTSYHPAVGYAPRVKPTSIDGHPVRWDAPVLAVQVNRQDGWTWGVGDLYSALPYARAYKEFLEDWARLTKALARWAFKAKDKGRNRAQARQALSAAPAADPITGAPQYAGATLIMPQGADLEPVPKTGATIDAESGRPLAAMVAAALGLPVTMLLGDPGITGARATAETLDRPTELLLQARQNVWRDFIRALMGYVIDQAIKAPQGALDGKRLVDPASGQESYELSGDGDRTVLVAFPDLDDEPTLLKVQAIVQADSTGKLPPLTILRLLADAFELDDVDELVDAVTDDQGEFIDPRVSSGQAAVDAARAGNDPAAQFGGQQSDAPPADDPATDDTQDGE